MKNRKLLRASFACILACSLPGLAQEIGDWRPASETARSVTGDLSFSEEKLIIDFSSFTIAQIRALTPAEINAAFDGAPPGGTGNLYRLSIPASRRFLHHNTLCGSDETQWMATYVAGRTLQLAFFSGPKMPVFTPDALDSSPNLCGTYSYTR